MAENKKINKNSVTKEGKKANDKSNTTPKKEKTGDSSEKNNNTAKKKETQKKVENQKDDNVDKKNSKTKKENIQNSEKIKTEQKQEKSNKKDTKKEQTSKTQLQKKEPEEIQEAVAKEIKANKKLPSSELGKINARVFQNICLAIVIMFYLDFIILGFINIENDIFITDLKVFSMVILIISIGIFEYAYKKDSGRHAIHGIEILVLAFVTIALIYVDLLWADKFIYIVAFITYIFAIYYVAKSIVIYNKMKKEYFVGEMKEIIK